MNSYRITAMLLNDHYMAVECHERCSNLLDAMKGINYSFAVYPQDKSTFTVWSKDNSLEVDQTLNHLTIIDNVISKKEEKYTTC